MGKKRSHKTWKFVLYVTRGTERSDSAISNLEQICNSYLGDDYSIEVVDLLEHPELARQHQIMAVPTAIRTYPLPERRVIGDLSRPEMVVTFLELPTQRTQTTRLPDHPVSPSNHKETSENKPEPPEMT